MSALSAETALRGRVTAVLNIGSGSCDARSVDKAKAVFAGPD